MSVHDHGTGGKASEQPEKRKLVLVGTPNVGKSVLFHELTGVYVTVSNYPGTTVAVDHGKGVIGGERWDVIDTPGMYSLLPITEEERVARRILLDGEMDLVVQVADAKNLERALPITIQLAAAGFPVILVLNMMDEARARGMEIDIPRLQEKLGVPVVGTAAILGEGMRELRTAIAEYEPGTPRRFTLPQGVEDGIGEIVGHLHGDYPISSRAMALLLLQGDDEVIGWVREKEDWDALEEVIRRTREEFPGTVQYAVSRALKRHALAIADQVCTSDVKARLSFNERLSRATMRPITGIPILVVVVFFGLYVFVGVLGAGILVDWIETKIFENNFNPMVDGALATYVPWQWLRDLVGGDYGILTLGFRYAFAIVLPIVGTFFLAFSIIEDSGYLPRLAMLVDRVFKRLGMNGRAIIPLVLGLGCDTMATVVTRTQETRRERLIATFLLALAIPCSAQLGLILGLMTGRPMAMLLWAVIIIVILAIAGTAASKLLPGARPSFYMEIPPLRMPKISNVLVKTYSRMVWYFKEVFPLFVLASVLIWIGHITGIFQLLILGMEPVVGALGLPPEAANAFLYGFFRRDYGAAGLYDIRAQLNGVQILVSSVTLTLFLPCIAQVVVMFKERGWKASVVMLLVIFPFALFVGWLLNVVLTGLGVVL